MRPRHTGAGVLVLLMFAAVIGAAGATATSTPRTALAQSRTVVSGDARFEILSPTLIRVEYSPTATFEDQPTETAEGRQAILATPAPAYTLTDNGVTLTIDTGVLQLHYVENTPFAAGLTFTLKVGGTETTVIPAWNECQQTPTVASTSACGPTDGLPSIPTSDDIGGYQREVVSESVNGTDVFYPQTSGMLTTRGYYLLDDTGTALRTEAPGAQPTVAARPLLPGYQDGYFFGYGQNYAQGLKDLSDLTGAAPILPEWTFGTWFSDYQNYKATDYVDTIFPKLDATKTPIDGLVLDTNWKDPQDSWNSYDFNKAKANPDFPDPAGFLAWAKAQGLHTVLNIHPSIDETDPNYAAAKATAGSLSSLTGGCEFYRTSPACDVFDWSVPAQAKAFFNLQEPLLDMGIANLWNDWCCDASNTDTVAGVTPDSLVADQYAQQLTAHGGRGYVLARVGSGIYSEAGQLPNSELGDVIAPATGAWAAHRSTIGFTGDATSDFQTLEYEAKLEPGESAAIGLPYLSNDIGGYSGGHLGDDLYARWVQLGTFSSILRLHGKNSDRLPYEYADGSGADVSAERFLRLREALVPYSYTAAAQAHDTGMPMVREMALVYPGDSDALAATDEWMYGDNLLVAPITTAGTTASRSVWIPPGQWTDFFTGATVTGPATITTPAEGFDRAPVYVKAGGIVTLAPPMLHVGAQAEDPLTIRVGSGAAGASSLYEDAGDGDGYLAGQRSSTPLTYTEPSAAGGVLVVGARQGSFPGAASSRAYAVQFLASARPAVVTVQGVDVPETTDTGGLDMTSTASTRPGLDSWSYDPATRTITVLVASRSTSSPVTIAHDVPASSGAAATATTTGTRVSSGKVKGPSRVRARSAARQPTRTLAFTGLAPVLPAGGFVLLAFTLLVMRSRRSRKAEIR